MQVKNLAATAILLALTVTVNAQAQGRRVMDYETTRRLEMSVDSFHQSIDAALDRSRFNGTSREDYVNALVDELEDEADKLQRRAKDNEAIAADVETVLARAISIDTFMRNNRLSPRAQNDWVRVRSNLDQLARMHNIRWVWSVTPNAMMPAPLVKQTIRRIEVRTDEFQNSLDSALDRSPLDGTEAQDKINALVENLERDADALKNRMDSSPGGTIAPADVESLLKRALMIDEFMRNNHLTSRAQRDWARVKVNLNDLADAYKMARVWTLTITPVTSSTR